MVEVIISVVEELWRSSWKWQFRQCVCSKQPRYHSRRHRSTDVDNQQAGRSSHTFVVYKKQRWDELWRAPLRQSRHKV